MRKTLFTSGLLFLLVAFVNAQDRRQLVSSAMAIRPGNVQPFYFEVAVPNSRVVGRFQSADNIEVYILDKDAYTNWMNGARVYPFYNSGRITVSNVNVTLPVGSYVLVFSNRYSVLSSKAITATIYLEPPNNPPSYDSRPSPFPSEMPRVFVEAYYDEAGRIIELQFTGVEVEGCFPERGVGTITRVKYNARRVPVEFVVRRNNKRAETVYTQLETAGSRSPIDFRKLSALFRRGRRVQIGGSRCGISGHIFTLTNVTALN